MKSIKCRGRRDEVKFCATESSHSQLRANAAVVSSRLLEWSDLLATHALLELLDCRYIALVRARVNCIERRYCLLPALAASCSPRTAEMSLFGDDNGDELPSKTPRRPQSSSLFDAGAGSSVKPSPSLFDDGNGGESPWDMPTPRKASRGEMIRNLLGPGEVPESYVDAFDVLLDSGERSGQNISGEAAKKLLASARLPSVEQARLLKLVAPGGAEPTGLSRSEFNVLLALIALTQEGSEEVSLDTVDERRSGKLD